MQNRIFISRSLNQDSPIRLVADKSKLDITDLSLIEFSAVKFTPPTTSWIFFYSQRGVDYFFSQLPQEQHQAYQVGCFGRETAQHCRQFCKVAFDFNSDLNLALRLMPLKIGREKTTFICGRQSLRTLHTMVDNYDEVIVYDQEMKQMDHLGVFNVALLTSPLNVKAFFKCNGAAESYIAIGSTTAMAIESHGVTTQVAVAPSEMELAKTLDRILIHGTAS